MNRSEHFRVVVGKWLHVYSLSVGGHKYVISGVASGNSLVLRCSVLLFMGIFPAVFRYLDSDVKLAHSYSVKGMYRVREEVAFEHWLSRGFMYNAESNTLCPISYELTDNSYVFYCSDESVPVLANRETGTYGFAKDKFPFIVPFPKFNSVNIVESLHHNVVKHQ